MRVLAVTSLLIAAVGCKPGPGPATTVDAARGGAAMPAIGGADTTPSSAGSPAPVASAPVAGRAAGSGAATTSPAGAAAVSGGAAEAPPSCIDDGEPYTEDALRAHLGQLASRELDGRAPGSAGDAAARAYIAARFRCLGLTPAGADGGYQQPFSAAGQPTANVIGYIAGGDPDVGDQIIVVGAHHDHVGDGHLGANDNASGVTALLAIAQAIRRAPAGPRRTIAFVAFGGEEVGLVGSTRFVAEPPAALPLDRVVQLINLDMVGSYRSRNAVHAFGTFARLPATTALAALDDHHRTIRVGYGGHSVRGDQVGFCKRGIPYVFWWTPDARCYHETCDTVDNIDLPHMAAIVALAGALVRELADTEVDLAAARARRGCGRR